MSTSFGGLPHGGRREIVFPAEAGQLPDRMRERIHHRVVPASAGVDRISLTRPGNVDDASLGCVCRGSQPLAAGRV